MWSPDAVAAPAQGRPSRRTALGGLAALFLAGPLLGGCENSSGLRPLYGSIGGSRVEEKLAAVEIAPIPGRVGQRIRNELIFQATGGERPAPPHYRLEITTREVTTSTLVLRDGNSAGQVYQVDAAFKLINLADRKVVLEGVSFGRAGFERNTSIFSNVRANEEAQDRAAKTVAADLKSRLAAFLGGAA